MTLEVQFKSDVKKAMAECDNPWDFLTSFTNASSPDSVFHPWLEEMWREMEIERDGPDDAKQEA